MTKCWSWLITDIRSTWVSWLWISVIKQAELKEKVELEDFNENVVIKQAELKNKGEFNEIVAFAAKHGRFKILDGEQRTIESKS